MKIAASFLISSVVIGIISTNESSEEECSEETVNKCLLYSATCVCRLKEEFKRITTECCRENFNSTRSFKQEVKNCMTECVDFMCFSDVAFKCKGCNINESNLIEKCMDYYYWEKPETADGCNEEFWNKSKKHFKEACDGESDENKKKICEAVKKCEQTNATKCMRQKSACLSCEWRNISATCCEESIGEEFIHNDMECKFHKLTTLYNRCDLSDCIGLPLEEEDLSFEYEWLLYGMPMDSMVMNDQWGYNGNMTGLEDPVGMNYQWEYNSNVTGSAGAPVPVYINWEYNGNLTEGPIDDWEYNSTVTGLEVYPEIDEDYRYHGYVPVAQLERPKVVEECRNNFYVTQEEEWIKISCNNRTEKKQQDMCNSFFKCRSEE